MSNLIKNLVKSILLANGKNLVAIDHELDDPFAFQLSLFESKRLTIFDIGVAIGTIADDYRKRLFSYNQEANYRIYCFEPLPQYFKILKSNFSEDPRVICENIALSSTIGLAKFHQGALLYTSSLLPISQTNETAWGEGISLTTEQVISVPTTTLDAYCLQNSIHHINIPKIDAQGGEKLILEGTRNFLNTQRIDLIYLEVIFEATYQGQPTPGDILTIMNQYDYKLINIYNTTKSRGKLMQVDVLFASKSFLLKSGLDSRV